MPRHPSPHPRVVVSQSRKFVLVSHDWASPLRRYLAAAGVRSSAPEPVDSENDSIELPEQVDTETVKTHLSRWDRAR